MNDLINQIQDTIFNARESMTDKTYKDALELVGKLHNLNEEKSFENECQTYKVAFIRNRSVFQLPLENKEVCEYPEFECCKGLSVQITPETFTRQLVLHPILVEYLEESDYIKTEFCESDLTHPGSVFSKWWLGQFLNTKYCDKKDMSDKLCAQYEGKIYPIILDNSWSVVEQTSTWGEDVRSSLCRVTRYYRSKNSTILFKIRKVV